MLEPTLEDSRPKRALPTVIAIVLIMLIGSVGGFVWWQSGLQKAPTADYATTTVKRGDLAIVVAATGTLGPSSSAGIGFDSAGKIAEILVKPGDVVKAGQVLARQDTTELQAAVDQATAALIQANGAADVAIAQAQVGTAQTALATARTALASATEQRAKALAGDQVTVADATKNLAAVASNVAAAAPVQDQEVEKAKDDLWATQTDRDGICGHGPKYGCDAANARVGAAETAVTLAVAERDQAQKQGALQVVQAQTQLDEAQAQLDKDQAELDAAVAAGQNEVKQADAGLVVAQANVADVQAGDTTAAKNAGAALALAKAHLEAATLRAPFAGTVAAVNGAAGQWAVGGAGGTSFIQLDNLNELQIVAQVNEADMARLAVGDTAEFTVNAFPDQTFDGRVSAIQPLGTSSQNVVSYGATIAVDHTEARLLAGMTANVNIAVESRKGVLVVPVAALSVGRSRYGRLPQKPDVTTQSGVVMVLSNGEARARTIEYGLSDGRFDEVVSGLEAGEVVVVGANESGQGGTQN